MLTQEEKLQLFSRLPDLELSYEPRLHKKVYAPLYYIIPKGPKALVWYTYWREYNVCLLVLLNERGNYSDIRVMSSVFSNQLALGTILYGTYFLHHQQHFFTCEQVHYYKGIKMKQTHLQETILLDLFKTHIEQVAYTSASLVVGMPVITTSYEEAEQMMADLPYRTYGIGRMHKDMVKGGGGDEHKPAISSGEHKPVKGGGEHKTAIISGEHKPAIRDEHKPAIRAEHKAVKGSGDYKPAIRAEHKPVIKVNTTTLPSKQIFKVKAALSADTYHLYSPTDNKLIGTAVVPTYKYSVLLNSLFRNIKENTNLDLLEESDEEEEFENTQLDKFVDLEKTILMECVYLKRFQKWQPIKIFK